MGNPVVDVIVPVYRPDDKFYKLLQQLKQQTWPVHRIILMNTEKKIMVPIRARVFVLRTELT